VWLGAAFGAHGQDRASRPGFRPRRAIGPAAGPGARAGCRLGRRARAPRRGRGAGQGMRCAARGAAVAPAACAPRHAGAPGERAGPGGRREPCPGAPAQKRRMAQGGLEHASVGEAVRSNPRVVMPHVEIVTALLTLGRSGGSIDVTNETRRQNPRGHILPACGRVCGVKGIAKEAQRPFGIALHFDPALAVPGRSVREPPARTASLP